MVCQTCGAAEPTSCVTFYHNIGAVVVRVSGCVEGDLCRSCVHRYFWTYTAINCCLGWWGVISFFITPFFLLYNVIEYLRCLFERPARDRDPAARGAVTRPVVRRDWDGECYLCGNDLLPDERHSRVCRDCRS